MTFSPSVDRFRPALWFGALLLLIVFFESFITTLPVFTQSATLPAAVTFDLLVGIPGLFYVLVVRPYHLSLASLVGVVGSCLALAFWVLPVAQQWPLHRLYMVPAALEAVALVLVAAKIRCIVRAYRGAYAAVPLFWPSAQAAARSLGRVGEVLLFEVEMLRCAVVGWWATPETRTEATAFSNYRESGFVAFAAMVGGILVVEATALHLLVGYWRPALTSWLLLLDGYAVVTLVGHIHAVRLCPALLTPRTLRFSVGSMWRLEVPRAELLAVEFLRDIGAVPVDALQLTKLLFTSPNLLLTFAEPVVVVGPYGIRRTARRVAVYLDQPHQFMFAAGFSHPSTR